MLKNKFSYYFWRVAIGVSIGLILMFARGKAYALSYQFETGSPVALFSSSKVFNYSALVNEYTVQYTFDTPYYNEDYDFMMFNYTMVGLVTDGDTNREYQVTNFQWYAWLFYSDNSATNCVFDSGMMLCPLQKNKTVNKIQFRYPPIRNTVPSGTNLSLDLTLYFTRYGTPLKNSFTSMAESSSQTAQNTKETAENTKKIADEISDNSDANIDVSGMSGVTGLLPAGPLDSLLALPVNLLTILVNSTSGSCQPFTFTFVFDSEWTLPCFDTFWNQVPSSLLLFMSDLPAVYIFIKWAKSIYSRVERAVSFESSVEDEWGGV